MFKAIDNFFCRLEGKSKAASATNATTRKAGKGKSKKVLVIGAGKINSLGSAIQHLFVSKGLEKVSGLDGLDGWKDDKEKFKIDLLNDIKTFLFTKWEKPWEPGLIFNENSNIINGFRNIHGRVYKEQGNVIGLERNKGNSPFFITIKDLENKGGTITDPSKRTTILSYVPISEEIKKGGKKESKIKFMLPKFHSVINVDYVEGIKKPAYKTEEFKGLELNEYVENFIKQLVKLNRLPKLFYDQSDKAYYGHRITSWEDDSIHLVPINNFKNIEAYYSTLFHEITHSTMNPNRCGRGENGNTVKLDYPNEELVAEMGAMIICSELGLNYNRQNSITYLKGWLNKAGNDKDIAMIEAYAYACDAADYLMKDIDFDALVPETMKNRMKEDKDPEPEKPTKSRRKKTAKKVKAKSKKVAGRKNRVKIANKYFKPTEPQPDPEKKTSPATPPSEPDLKPLTKWKQQSKGKDNNVESQFFYEPDNNNLSQLDEQWKDTLGFKKLKLILNENVPLLTMLSTGIPLNYAKEQKLTTEGAYGNINIPPITTKIAKANNPFNALIKIAPKKHLHIAFEGVYFDAENDYMVATDAFVLFAYKTKIAAEKKNIIIDRTGGIIDAKFPNWQSIIPNCDEKVMFKASLLLAETAGILNAKKLTYDLIYLVLSTLQSYVVLNPVVLHKILSTFVSLGMNDLMLSVGGTDRAVVIKDKHSETKALIMPINANLNEKLYKIVKTAQYAKLPEDTTSALNGIGEQQQLFGIDDVNSQFNRELEHLIKGDLPDNHVFKLGMPDKKYLKNGINNLPIELSAKTLLNKANKNYKRQHPFELKDVKNLPLALKHPIALFKGEQGRVVALLELQNHGNNFVAIIGLFKHPKGQRRGIEVNSIITIYPKDAPDELQKMLQLPTLWDDKKKMSRFNQTHNSCYAGGLNPTHSDTNINNNRNKSNISPLKGFGLTKLGTGEKPQTYMLQGGLGEFLGEFDRLHYSIVLRGDKGAGKSRLLYQFIDAFASINLKTAFLSLEMHPDSSVSVRYRDEYIQPDNFKMIDVTSRPLSYDELNDLCKSYDVVAIDSWTKLKGMEQTDFDRLQKDNPQTIILGIFQSTTGKVTRGGNMPEYDAGTVIQVNKGGLAECEKNRYAETNKTYSVFDRCIVEIEVEDGK